MKWLRNSLLAVILLLQFGAGQVGADNISIDPSSGLIIAPGWELVKINCTVCHSARFITFQRGDRESWTSMIRWMQETQGLWKFDAKTEDIILTYLADNYPPGKSSRRRNLRAADLPVRAPQN